ncbi:alpha/beta hydrolase [Kocuria atrinae]|uniref:alpha/beta hydrolase n=1 Tax=Kocuria atrinae TaxID=592377 RepID=UPI000376B7D6|nr:alpha/beta hydrolase [Kocuria atrinae]
MDPDADLSVTSVAEAVAGVLARACPNGYWIVASDTGGVVAQLMLCDHSGGIRGALLLPCDLYDNFLPIALRYLQWVAPVPGAMLLVRFVLEIRLIRSLPIAFGWLTRSGLSPELVRQTIDPLKDAGIRRDLVKLLRAIEPDITRRAASLLPQTTVPVRFLWATDDRLFPVRMARKLSDAMGPMSTWTEVDESYSFIQIDRPDAVTDGIDKMAGLGLRRNEASQ